MSAARRGKCLCGAVPFEASPAEPHFETCHCTTCRKWGGGPAFATTVTDLALAEDAPVTWFSSSDFAERGFCATCGTHLFWRLKEGGFITVFTGAFDTTDDLTFAAQIFTDEKPAAYAFANKTAMMTGAEVFATFMGDQT